jgi:hypothetical protein
VGIEGVHEMVEAVTADRHQHYSLIEVGTLWHRTNWLRGFELAMDVVEDRPRWASVDGITDFLPRGHKTFSGTGSTPMESSER